MVVIGFEFPFSSSRLHRRPGIYRQATSWLARLQNVHVLHIPPNVDFYAPWALVSTQHSVRKPKLTSDPYMV